MKKYFKKLVRDKDFWILFIGGIVLIVIGLTVRIGKESYVSGQFAGAFIGVGITLLAIILTTIMENIGKIKKEQHDKQPLR